MPLFRKGAEAHSLSIAMTGVKLGDRLLQIGCSDATLLGVLAAKAGLSGRASVVVESAGDAERARASAARAGALVEIEEAPLSQLPFADGSFDIVVIDNTGGLIADMRPEQRVGCLQEARRVLIARGRAIVIERAPRAGLAGLFSRQPVDSVYRSSGGATTALQAEGFRAVRALAEREGLSFVEGTK